jgi:N-acetylglucosamine-6-phosphate deacetylase
VEEFWITGGQLLTPRGIVPGAVQIARGRIAAIRRAAHRGACTISARGAYVAPGFIDLHVWGEPAAVSRDAARGGATAFLATLGPNAPQMLLQRLSTLNVKRLTLNGAECLGVHLEGPFLNPVRGGVLPKRAMRSPSISELARLRRASRGRLRLVTLAPERPGGLEAIRWCRRHRVVASLGHSDADYAQTKRSTAAGASAVTHVFNGMRPLNHRAPSLVDAALTDPRLTAMVIADGVHVSSPALRLLFRAKGAAGVALVTDSVRGEAGAWRLRQRDGVFYAPDGTLAGSALTMIQAVRNAVRLGGAPLEDAIRMASETPARLLGVSRARGTLAPGKRADLVVFDAEYQVWLTIVDGRIVYQRDKR